MNYNTGKWERKRSKILKKQGYMCQECKRYGKRIDANTAHHIYPAEDYTEYVWCDWNLISLCSTCHNSMHNRNDRSLTEKGERLKLKTIPPPQTQL